MRFIPFLMLFFFFYSCSEEETSINSELLTSGTWTNDQSSIYNLSNDSVYIDYHITKLTFQASGDFLKTEILRSKSDPPIDTINPVEMEWTPPIDTLATAGTWNYLDDTRKIDFENFELDCIRPGVVGESDSTFVCPDVDFVILELNPNLLKLERLLDGERMDPSTVITYHKD